MRGTGEDIMRIAVIGTGVVGGYSGGYLAHGERMLYLLGAEEPAGNPRART